MNSIKTNGARVYIPTNGDPNVVVHKERNQIDQGNNVVFHLLYDAQYAGVEDKFVFFIMSAHTKDRVHSDHEN